MKISIIGTGNVAWHLTNFLEEAGHTIIEIWSRDAAKAKKIASKLYQAKGTNSLNFTNSKAEIFIIAVSDDAIQSIVNQILIPAESVICHTSGSVGIEIFENHSHLNKGVFYPLQSFTKGVFLDWQKVPICIEASNENTDIQLTTFAETISEYVYYLDSAQRKKLHLAAIFANNFSNLMFTYAEEILSNAEIPFDILHPILNETVEKAIKNLPSNSQTGPASRGDKDIIKNHLNLLYLNDELSDVYKLLSENLLSRHQ